MNKSAFVFLPILFVLGGLGPVGDRISTALSRDAVRESIATDRRSYPAGSVSVTTTGQNTSQSENSNTSSNSNTNTNNNANTSSNTNTATGSNSNSSQQEPTSPTPSGNVFSTGGVTFKFDDGWSSQYSFRASVRPVTFR